MGRPKKVVVQARKNSIDKLMSKYQSAIGERDEYLDFNVRGEKARRLSEIAQVLKAIGTSQSFQISILEFEKAYGPGKKGRTSVKAYLKRFGIPNPRVEPSADKVHIWYRGKIEEAK